MKSSFKKFVSIILAVTLMGAVFLILPISAADGGNINSDFIEPVERKNTTPGGYTPVYTPEDLDNVRNDLTGNYILMNDIDLSEWGTWTSIIGSYNQTVVPYEFEPFSGVFDGNGYAIKNLSGKYGLFARLKNASVRNLGMIACEIGDRYSNNEVGAIANITVSSSIVNCYNTGDVHGSALSGGFAVLTFASAGGIAGKATDSVISKCYNVGMITASTDVGYNEAFVGGIVGTASNTQISNCYNTGYIAVNGNNGIIRVGGIAGISSSPISNCYNTSLLWVSDVSTACVGGIVGELTSSISNCYSTGTGFMPERESDPLDEFFPPIVVPQPCIGGIAAQAASQSVIENCYYLDVFEVDLPSGVLSYYPNAVGDGQGTLSSVLALTDEQMRQKNSFAGFDFENVWAMSDDGGYPVFKSMVPVSDPDPDPLPTPSNGRITQWLKKLIESIMRALIGLFTFGLIGMR